MNVRDLAIGQVVTAPSPTDAGTTLTLDTGQGGDMPAVPFRALAHPEGELPTKYNAEIITVYDVTGDVISFDRAQGETPVAKNISTGWLITNAVFADDVLVRGISGRFDVETPVEEENITNKAYVDAAIAAAITATKEALFPIGSHYYNSANGTNPAELLGFGTWVAVEGVVLGGVSGVMGSDFNTTPGSIIGEEKHTMTLDELAAHSHTAGSDSHNHTGTTSTNGNHNHQQRGYWLAGSGSQHAASRSYISGDPQENSNLVANGNHNHTFTTSTDSHSHSISTVGSNTPFNVIQRTKVGFLWERTA